MGESQAHVVGTVRGWLRVEGLAELVFALTIYSHLGRSWMVFALCFLLPDVSFVGYLAGPRVGAWVYNLAHSTVGPFVLLAMSSFDAQLATVVGSIWLAHIGFDRLLGYGLKYPRAFTDTHLGPIGRARG